MARSLILLLLLALPAIGLGQGKLDQVREAVDKPPAKDDDSSHSDSSWSLDGPELTGDEFLAILTFPWSLPNALFEKDHWDQLCYRFGPHPFADPGSRYMVHGRQQEDGSWSFDKTTECEWWSVRASAEAGSDFDGLDRVGLRLFLDTDTRFGLKSDWDWYTEKLACGCRDDLWIGDLTATLRFVQNEWLVMHTGLGARFLVDHGNDRAGINFLYGFDAFPVQPVHLFGSFEAGTLRHADVYRLRGGVGVNWTHAELFAGYDFVRIGGVNLQGPMIGLRLWF